MKIVKLMTLFLFIFCRTSMAMNNASSEDYTIYAYEVMDQFEKEVRDELGLICIGNGGRMSRDVEVIRLCLQAYQRATVKEARMLQVRCMEKLISIMNTHEKIRPFLRKYPVDLENVDVSIAFCKKNNKRYTDGSVAFIFEAKGKILYFSKDEKSKDLVRITEEPYEEAVKLVRTSEMKK